MRKARHYSDVHWELSQALVPLHVAFEEDRSQGVKAGRDFATIYYGLFIFPGCLSYIISFLPLVGPHLDILPTCSTLSEIGAALEHTELN